MTRVPVYIQTTEDKEEAASRIKGQLGPSVLLSMSFKQERLSTTAFQIHS